jgi:AraC-like DNA-binding protein
MTVNLHRKIALAELANLVHLSASHFSRLFKMETGLSPGEFLIRLRMEKAHELLITRFESIKEVMAMVGYGNKSNFVRHFKRFYGFAPSEYRKRHLHRSSHVATRKQ